MHNECVVWAARRLNLHCFNTWNIPSKIRKKLKKIRTLVRSREDISATIYPIATVQTRVWRESRRPANGMSFGEHWMLVAVRASEILFFTYSRFALVLEDYGTRMYATNHFCREIYRIYDKYTLEILLHIFDDINQPGNRKRWKSGCLIEYI